MRLSSLSLIICSTLLLSSCTTEPVSEKKHFSVFTIGTGAFTQTDNVMATVEGKTTADLSFKASGRIATMSVEPGQSVKKGQILATLGNEEASITTAGLSNILGDITGIRSSVGSLYDNRIENLANDSDRARLGVELATKDLELAKQILQNSRSIFSDSILSSGEKVSQAEKGLEYARNNLVNSEKLLAIQGESLRKNALNSMSNAFIVARNARDFADQTLGVTEANRSKNDAFEIYLGAKNSAVKTTAENSFRAFNAEYETMYAWYYVNIVGKDTVSKETLSGALGRSLRTLEHLREMLHTLSNTLENSISSSNFSESDLDALKNKTTAFLSNTELSMLDSNGGGVKGSIAAIDVFDSGYALKIQQLEDSVKLAEADLALAKTGKDTSSGDVQKNLATLTMNIKMKEDALKLAQVSISSVEKNREILDSERKSKLSETDSKLSETRMNKNLANNTIESGIIRAPFDGIILKKYLESWVVVSAGTPVFAMSSSEGKRVRVLYDAATYGMQVGDTLSVKEASGSLYTATVTLVNPHPDATHNKAYLEAELWDFPGMIGQRVEVVFAKKIERTGSGVVIPTQALITRYGTPGVYILEGGHARFTLVELGRSEESFALVTGLSAGQKIITAGKENVLDGEAVGEY